MARSAALPVVLVIVLLLAGCAGGQAPASAGDPAPSVPEPGEKTGSIAGTVVGDEGIPLAGATVSVVETLDTTNTAPNGTFVFNDLAPGSYRLVVERLGYNQAAKNVDVTAGQTTELSVTLTALVVPAEPYSSIFPVSGHILLGWGLFDAFVTWDVLNATCDPCSVDAHFEPGMADVRVAPTWENSVDTPVTSQTLYIVIELANDGDRVWGKYVDKHEQHKFTETELEMVEDVDVFTVNMGGGVLDVMVDQRVDVWLGFSYNQAFADEFTPVPSE